MSVDLSKYLQFQKRNYTQIYIDVLNNKYDAGWIDLVLPRLEEQCDSPRSKGTGLNTEKELKSFWNNKLLKNNYLEILNILDFNILNDRAKFKIKQSINNFINLADEKELNILTNYLKKLN